MLVEIIYYRGAEGWHIRTVGEKKILHTGFDTKSEAEEFANDQKYEVKE